MENQKKTYQVTYDKFLTKCSTEQVDGEMAGKIIVYLTQEFINYNLTLIEKESRFNQIAAEKVQETDANTGKPLSVSKAEILMRATKEYKDLKEIKIDLENIEQGINSLKYLQKALLLEYSMMSSS